jgi:hypothetical protein
VVQVVEESGERADAVAGAGARAEKAALDAGDGLCRADFVDFKKFSFFIISAFDDASFFCLYVKSAFVFAFVRHSFDFMLFPVFFVRLDGAFLPIIVRQVYARKLDSACQNCVNNVCGRVERCKDGLQAS